MGRVWSSQGLSGRSCLFISNPERPIAQMALEVLIVHELPEQGGVVIHDGYHHA